MLPCHFTLYLAPSRIRCSHEANGRYVLGLQGFVPQRPFLVCMSPGSASSWSKAVSEPRKAAGTRENADGLKGGISRNPISKGLVQLEGF